ncbi:hypothetical protein [Aquibium sp. ELW1220]|uniref:hypothetical protein n=1 Tax=Aquibium sp. ELW1220 TaxID=2976766 RepID=UPI0025B0D543|nr:hypothetical protein [Aquibium sp. ELW1220]MDN2581404.1 hypothetical protein [Aquibium sp. ELW1220]
MSPRPPDRRWTEDGLDGAGAMADLILGTTGILLVVLLTLGPAALSRQGPADAPNILAPPAGSVEKGYAGPVLIARAEGLLVASRGILIPVSEIATSPHLAALGPATPLLIIEPDGLEAAFHASARLAAGGMAAVDRVRIDRTCAGMRRVERQGPALVLVCQGR